MKKGLLFACAIVVGGSLAFAQSTDGLTPKVEDDFSNNKSGWNLGMGGKEVSFINYNAKALVLDAGAAGGTARVTMNAPIGFNQDFVIKATLWCKECAGSKAAGFGLLFGQSSFENKGNEGYYSIRLLQDNGKDAVWVRVNNANGTVLYDQNVDASFDPDDENEVAIERVGENINIYINGTNVYSNLATETAGNEITYIATDKLKVFMKDLSFYTK